MSDQQGGGGKEDRPKRDRVFVRSADGKATVVSSRPENFAARLCTTHRITNLDDAKDVGLLPGFVNLPVLQRESGRVLDADSFDQEAARRVDSEMEAAARTAPNAVSVDGRIRQARIAETALWLRAADLAQVIEPSRDPLARTQIAGRTLKLLAQIPITTVSIGMIHDLDLYTDLAFAADVAVAKFGDVRIYSGARIVASAPHFILRAASVRCGMLRVEGHVAAGVNLVAYAAHQ